MMGYTATALIGSHVVGAYPEGKPEKGDRGSS